MKFVFINPKRSIEGRNVWRFINSSTPPLGLATLAAVLEQHGHRADVIDAATLELDIPGILSLIDPGTDVAGLTATTPEIEYAVSIAQEIKRSFPRIKIVMGGVHPTVFHQELVAQGDADMVIRGEGEAAVLSLARGLPLDTVPNLTWRRQDGSVIANPQASQYADLDALPFPAYHKLPMKQYRSALGAAEHLHP